MTQYLLDTNVCVEVLRARNPKIVHQLKAMLPGAVMLCSVVVAELYYGACKSGFKQANFDLLAAFLPQFKSLPFDQTSASLYGQVRADLESRGKSIGPNDLMIASIAVQHGLTVVTHNAEEFARVSGLTVEDWSGNST